MQKLEMQEKRIWLAEATGSKHQRIISTPVVSVLYYAPIY
jgi:hypothetical protein